MILTKKKLYSLWLVKEKLSRSVSFRFFSGGSKTSPSSELISKLEPAEVAEVVEVSKITDSMLSCLQDPVIQSTLIFVGVVVVVVCWQQFAVAALIQGAFCAPPVSSVPAISTSAAAAASVQHMGEQGDVGKIDIIRCFAVGGNKKEHLDVFVGWNNDHRYLYYDSETQLELHSSLEELLAMNCDGAPTHFMPMLKALAREMPSFISQFDKAPFPNPDFLVSEIAIRKLDYLFVIGFYFPY